MITKPKNSIDEAEKQVQVPVEAIRSIFVERYLLVIDNEMELEKILIKAFPDSSDIPTLLNQLDDLKSCLDSFRPLNQSQLENLQEAYDLEYTYESNRIEGNTLTLQETYLILHKGLTIGGKSLNEHLEAINHRDAIKLIKDIVSRKEDITERSLLDIHHLILRAIDNDNAGFYRQSKVRVTGSNRIFPNPLKVPDHMEEMFKEYKEEKDITHPVLLASKMHHKLVWIHPFADGNGRTARLLMNLILLRSGFMVENISADNKSRSAYYSAIQKADVGDYEDFHRFIIKTEKEALFKWLIMVSSSMDGAHGGNGAYFYGKIAPYL